jgi:hypothetical protein
MIEAHRLLLHACFDDDTRAWQEWQARVNVDHLDRHSQWLLPLLYRRLSALRVEHPLLQRYKNVYLHNWYKNTLLLKAAGEVAALLESIPAVAKTDLGCVMDIYEDVGVRPLHCAEICIPTDAWADLLHRLACWEHRFQLHALDCEQTNKKSLIISTNAHIPITVTTDDTGLPPGWPCRLEPTTFRNHVFTHFNATDAVAYLLAERTRWNERSDLLWWADVVTFTQTRLRSIAAQPVAQELLAVASPFLKNEPRDSAKSG